MANFIDLVNNSQIVIEREERRIPVFQYLWKRFSSLTTCHEDILVPTAPISLTKTFHLLSFDTPPARLWRHAKQTSGSAAKQGLFEMLITERGEEYRGDRRSGSEKGKEGRGREEEGGEEQRRTQEREREREREGERV